MGDMKYVAGVDIGNATTEVALAKIDGQDIEFLTSGIGYCQRQSGGREPGATRDARGCVVKPILFQKNCRTR